MYKSERDIPNYFPILLWCNVLIFMATSIIWATNALALHVLVLATLKYEQNIRAVIV